VVLGDAELAQGLVRESASWHVNLMYLLF